METKHTKGTWKLIYSSATSTLLVQTDKEPDIARVPLIIEEAEANAKLIAAAPDMLEALKIMTSLCKLKYGNLDPDVYEQINKAEAAIKKATE